MSDCGHDKHRTTRKGLLKGRAHPFGRTIWEPCPAPPAVPTDTEARSEDAQPWSALHIPEITEGAGGWRVFCHACSEEAGDYVPICKRQRKDWPPLVLAPVAPLVEVEAQRLSVSDEMVERAAEALIQDQTQGSCSLGKVCRECDCFATEDNGATRDGYARQHARAALRAALGSTE